VTLVPENPTGLSDEALRQIGVIAVESARLEWFLAGLVSTLHPDISHEEALRKRNSQKVALILRQLEEHHSWLGEGATDDTRRWTQRAGELLTQRGDLMHCTWILGESGELVSSHFEVRQPIAS
jgi:hypothetical protein